MSIVNGKFECVACKKEKVTYTCSGCLDLFCFNHLVEHREELSLELNDIEHDRNIFLETLTDLKMDLEKHFLIQQIHQWKKDSIEKIEQTAKECIELLVQPIKENIGDIEIELEDLTKQMKEIRQENDVNEIILNELKEKLELLKDELNEPSNILIRQSSSLFIKKIAVSISSRYYIIHSSSKWGQHGITVGGKDGQGYRLNQLSEPLDVYVNDDQTIYVADTENYRIIEWKTGVANGQILAGGNRKGYQNYQLSRPTNVILDKENDFFIISDYGNKQVVRWPRQNGKSGEIIISSVGCWGLSMGNNGYIYVSDIDKHEVKRWKIGERNGILVAGGNGKGDHLSQLNHPYNIFVDQYNSVYVSDCENDRIMKWVEGEKEGIVVAGGQGQGNSLTQLNNPRGIFVDRLGTIYVADYGNHRIMRWCNGAKQGNVILGGNGEGSEANQLNGPVSLSFDQKNNLYVADSDNNRIQKFTIELN